jgi:hypothetical protein
MAAGATFQTAEATWHLGSCIDPLESPDTLHPCCWHALVGCFHPGGHRSMACPGPAVHSPCRLLSHVAHLFAASLLSLFPLQVATDCVSTRHCRASVPPAAPPRASALSRRWCIGGRWPGLAVPGLPHGETSGGSATMGAAASQQPIGVPIASVPPLLPRGRGAAAPGWGRARTEAFCKGGDARQLVMIR